MQFTDADSLKQTADGLNRLAQAIEALPDAIAWKLTLYSMLAGGAVLIAVAPAVFLLKNKQR